MGLSALIGALRVSLGLDTAQYSKGFKTAATDMERFRRLAVRAGAAIGTALSGVAIGAAIRGAVNHADALSKAAQKAGVAVQALSRLEYAAKLSDVSLESLTGGLQKLGKSMADAVAAPTSAAATAFKSLGIEITNANGTLRNSDVVLAEIAGKFARLEDGSTKTALAMQMFGKSGTEMIPLLNTGSAGLKSMADESDRLGATISSKTAKAAERFNDTWTTIGVTMQGVVNKIMEAALPALQSFADMLASPDFARAAQTLATTVVGALDKITKAIVGVINMLTDLANKIGDAYAAATAPTSKRSTSKLQSDLQWHQDKLANPNINDSDRAYNEGMIRQIEAVLALRADLVAPQGPGGRGRRTKADQNTTPSDPTDPLDVPTFTSNIQKAQAALDPFAARMEELSGVLTATVDPFSQMKLDLTDLQTMFDNGRISAEQFGDAVFKTAAGGVGALADLAGGLTSALSQMFKENKAIAAANAVVNGIGSVAKTFETYGATPWGFAAAAIAATTAAANVASILSASESSRSMPGTAGSMGGMSAPSAAQGSAINLTVRGSGPIDVDDFVDQIAKGIADGGHQNLLRVTKAALV